MRAVRSTINAAGILKRQNPDAPENELVLKAVVDINLPKFLKNDLPLFENILSDLFPNVKKPKSELGILKNSIEESIEKLHYSPVPMFIEKI